MYILIIFLYCTKEIVVFIKMLCGFSSGNFALFVNDLFQNVDESVNFMSGFMDWCMVFSVMDLLVSIQSE